MKSFKRMGLLWAVMGGTVACDQGTKSWAVANQHHWADASWLGGFFRLTYAENPGAFLSLGAGLPDGVRFALGTVGVALLLLVALGWVLWRLPALPRAVLVAAALFIGGGAGNLVDRVQRGRVVDFMVMGVGPIRTGVFNVADVAIMLGAGLMLWKPRKREDGPAAGG